MIILLMTVVVLFIIIDTITIINSDNIAIITILFTIHIYYFEFKCNFKQIQKEKFVSHQFNLQYDMIEEVTIIMIINTMTIINTFIYYSFLSLS
jgi:hypothetical protein